MLTETKNTLITEARKLTKPYEQYSINELADAYCEATDSGNKTLRDIYISALILRFWYQIPKLATELKDYKVDYVDCYDGVLNAIEQACDPTNRKWQSGEYSAEQIINQILGTRFTAAKKYEANLQKNAGRRFEMSLDSPVCGGEGDDATKTVGDMLEAEESFDDHSADDIIMLIQSYINNNKIIEAILIDNIISNDVQKHFKKVVKTTNAAGEAIKYTEHSSEFWPYKLAQIVSKLPETYKKTFMEKYNISEEKLDVALRVLDKSNNPNNSKIYRFWDKTQAELKMSYAP